MRVVIKKVSDQAFSEAAEVETLDQLLAISRRFGDDLIIGDRPAATPENPLVVLVYDSYVE